MMRPLFSALALPSMLSGLYAPDIAPGRQSDGKRNLRPKPSKNDDPSWRKSIWPEGKVAKPGRMG